MSSRTLRAVLITGSILSAFQAQAAPKAAPAAPRSAAVGATVVNPPFASFKAERAASRSLQLRALGVDADQINRPWQIFLRALADKLGVSDGKYVQVVTAPQPADWNDPNFSAYRTSFYGDAMPKWGATFSPQTASSFADVYGTFINSIVIALPNPADQAKADDARNKWVTCGVQLQNQYKLIGKDWADFNNDQAGLPQNQKMPFQVWFRKFEAPQLQAYQAKCDNLAITYNSWFNKATIGQAGLANAIQRYSQAQQISALVPNTTDQYESVWPYTFIQSLSDFVASSAAKAQPDFDQVFDKTSGTYNATSSTWGASASYGWFFHASGGGSSSTVDTHRDEFRMHVTIKGLQVFDVRPGGWFSQQLVQAWRNGPFQPNSIVAQKLASGTLYGDGGFFSLRTARYVVAYQPRVELTMSADDYHQAKSAWEGGGGFGIGPFSFGGGASNARTDISWNDQTNTLVAQDTSTTPKVIAVVADVLPDFN